MLKFKLINTFNDGSSFSNFPKPQKIWNLDQINSWLDQIWIAEWMNEDSCLSQKLKLRWADSVKSATATNNLPSQKE